MSNWCCKWVKNYTKSLVRSTVGDKYLKFRIKSFCKVVRRGSYMNPCSGKVCTSQSPNDLDLRRFEKVGRIKRR